jgi:hypothetical protein
MKARCFNPQHPNYGNYGGRGITVCERYRSFEGLFADVGLCPPGCSLDRIDNDRGYEPSNCRWAPRAVQAQNRRPRKKNTLRINATTPKTSPRSSC